MAKQYDWKEYEYDGENGKIYIGIPRERLYIPAFVDNRDTILYELSQAGRGAGYFQSEGHRVDRNRDKIVSEFDVLEAKPEWLVMLDSDMEHPGKLPERLTKWERPIVGGLYFHRGHTHDPFVFKETGKFKDDDPYGRENIPLWTPMRDEVYRFLTLHDLPMLDGALSIDDCVSDPLLECDAVATGAICIHRSVIDRMKKPIFEYRDGGTSEDLQFCYEAKREGIPVFCDLSTISGHYNWVPMGQAQFRMLYEGRGVNLTTYNKKHICEWMAKYMDIPFEDAVEKIEKGNAHMVGDYWNIKQPKTPEEILAFYKDDWTGYLYLIELAHWNFTTAFETLRKPLVKFRAGNVLEIGAGIGSVAMQMAIQQNDVVASEINPFLRGFIEYRWADMRENLSTAHGDIYIVDEEEWKKAEDEQFGLVVALDTFEHMEAEYLRNFLKDLSRVMPIGGTLFYHNNFQQQNIYPMHFDHSNEWETWLMEAGFWPTGHMTAQRMR